MNRILPVAVKHGLPLAGGAIGYLIAGMLGMSVGIGFGIFVPVVWRLFSNRHGMRTGYQSIASSYYEKVGPDDKMPGMSRAMFWALLICSVSFILYSFVIGLFRNSAALSAWMEGFQPAVDSFAAFIPALQQMPFELRKSGYPEWAPVVQHVVFLGWAISLLAATWIAIDVLVIHRRAWGRAVFLRGRSELIKMILLLSVGVVVGGLLLFFGSIPKFESGLFAGAVRLSVLAFLFVAVLFFFLTLTVTCNAFLRTYCRVADATVERGQSAIMQHKMTKLVRSKLFGKSARH